MAERIIHTADLSSIERRLNTLSQQIAHVHNGVKDVDTNIERRLNTLSQQIAHVHNGVKDVDTNIEHVQNDITSLEQKFDTFVEMYKRETQISLSETRLIKIRQEIEKKFGHYDDVRRAAIGLLQATDINIVHTQNIRDITEELMILTPTYWLAPALVAFSAWMQDNKDLAERALHEALRRDNEKTSLFFTLVCRRAQRNHASVIWLNRYLGNQNPIQLKRQVIVLINATADGTLSLEMQKACHQHFQKWIDELTSREGFIEQQRQQWHSALMYKVPAKNYETTYPQLAHSCKEWTYLNTQLNRTSLNDILLHHLRTILEVEIPHTTRHSDAVDDLLTNLITNHDTEELPLKAEETRLETIISQNGKVDEAQKKYDLIQHALQEEISFTQILTNAAMHNNLTSASHTTQKLSLSLSRDWLRDAFLDITLTTRRQIRPHITLRIGNWSGQTKNGTEEQELHHALEQHIMNEYHEHLSLLKIQRKQKILFVIGLLATSSIIEHHFVIALLGSLGILNFIIRLYAIKKAKKAIKNSFTQRKNTELSTLHGCLSEYVEWLRYFNKQDAKASETTAYINAITPDNYLMTRSGSSRRFINTP